MITREASKKWPKTAVSQSKGGEFIYCVRVQDTGFVDD
ncbi:hypothetical protein PRUB_a2010 [Pseudoalteromonas rubra]|uniref:Uncharacterized protein n=1 Tax=Pseudoalteromonas rubra TaxID=43658 RepID=A0A8T0CDX8_9GAMM|nr:hypothetical protein PRUB_a2010 [Pseudoalteromonas rubra]